MDIERSQNTTDSTSDFSRKAPRIADNGYSIITIGPGGKFPAQYENGKWFGYSKWPLLGKNPATPEQIEAWSGWPECGVGIICGRVIVIDIDVLEPVVARAVENLAREYLGDTSLVRIGKAPKRAMFYQTKVPFRGIKQHPIEIHAEGQQVVVEHIHPETGMPYVWREESLADVDISDLPVITEEEVRHFLAEADKIIPEHLKPKTLTQKTRQTREHFTGNSDLRGTREAIVDALTHVPNPDLAYDEWISVGMGIKGALGDGGYQLFLAWSAQAAKNDPDFTEKTWGTLHPTSKGAGSVYYLARERGWVPKAEHTLNYEQARANAEVDISAIIEKAKAFGAPLDGGPTSLSTPGPQERAPIHLELPPFPSHCLVTDGLLHAIIEWINKSAIKRQPELTFLNVLAALGTVYGRRYKSPWDTRTNLYTVGIARTAAGKDHSRKQIKKLLLAAGCANLLMGDRVSSGQSFLKALAEWPSKLSHLDEFGLMLKEISGRNASSTQENILKTLMELYSSSDGTYLGNEYASRDIARIDLEEPCLSVYGTSTPETLFPSLSSGAVVNGFLNRFIILPSQFDYPKAQRPLSKDVPEALIARVKDACSIKSEEAGNLTNECPNSTPDPIEVPWGPGVEETVLQQDEEQSRRLDAGGEGNQLWGRLTENSIKLAMISAISFDPHAPVITAERFQWAREIVEWSVLYLIDAARDRIADTQVEVDFNDALRLIKKTKKDGITKTGISRSIKRLVPKVREPIIAHLLEMGDVVSVSIPTKGATETRYFLRDYAPGLQEEA